MRLAGAVFWAKLPPAMLGSVLGSGSARTSSRARKTELTQ